MSGSSGFTVSPGFTNISITGTSLKSPMSGTRTSATPAGALVGAGGATTEGTGRAALAAAGAPAPASRSRMRLPSLTLSPTLTLMSFTMPAAGAGTSIVALSDSSETSGSSAFTLSPGLDQHLDHRHVLEVADVRNLDFCHRSHVAPLESVRAQTVQGSGRSVSRPYFLIASSTFSGLISPSSASAFSAATAT